MQRTNFRWALWPSAAINELKHLHAVVIGVGHDDEGAVGSDGHVSRIKELPVFFARFPKRADRRAGTRVRHLHSVPRGRVRNLGRDEPVRLRWHPCDTTRLVDPLIELTIGQHLLRLLCRPCLCPCLCP